MSDNIREDAVPQALRKALIGYGISADDDEYTSIADDFVEAYYEYVDSHQDGDDVEA